MADFTYQELKKKTAAQLKEIAKEEEIEIAVQVNGKMRGTIQVPADAEKAAVLASAKQDENVARHLNGKTLRREIYVPGRIVNFVAN